MRKITKKAVEAFLAGRRFSRSNTAVQEEDGYIVMCLHDSTIARYPVDKLWAEAGEVRTCGWNTPVTFERLNGLPGVHVCRFAPPMLGNFPWENPEDWTPYRRPNPEPCASQDEEKKRDAVIAWLGQHSVSVYYPNKPVFLRRTTDVLRRKSGLFHRTRVDLPKWEAPAWVCYRPWAANPCGEVKLNPSRKGIPFTTWAEFAGAVKEAERRTAPDLVKLAEAAREIL